jgi:hypothetical protein
MVAAALVLLFSLAPAEERWLARFPSGFFESQEYEFNFEGRKKFEMEFEAVVSERGSFGHEGLLHRTVEILRVLKYERV